jgi:ubiquinone/menaquinone biosynthesis C-methylase UbiE
MDGSHAEDVERFNRWADTYETFWGRRFFDRMHQAALDLVAGGEEVCPRVVLDVGCGTGRLLRAAARRWPGARLIGVDPAEAMVTVARRLTPEAEFHVAGAESLPLPDAVADVVLSTISFHHWGDQAAGLREVARVLRPGGRFGLADVSLPAWLAKLVRHPGARSTAVIRALFSQAGMPMRAQQRMLARTVLVAVGRKESGQAAAPSAETTAGADRGRLGGPPASEGLAGGRRG